MSILKVRPPGAARWSDRIICTSAMLPMASADCSASVTGAMAPISVTGMTMTHWPCLISAAILSRISLSTRRGELTVVTDTSVGCAGSPSIVVCYSTAEMGVASAASTSQT